MAQYAETSIWMALCRRECAEIGQEALSLCGGVEDVSRGDAMKRLKGKKVLITGGGTGIGAAIARRFVSEGARVCIAGRRQKVLDDMRDSFPAGTIAAVAGDVTKESDVARMIRTATEFAGGLDVLVSSAGGNFRAPVADLDLSMWRQILDTNLTAAFLLMRAAIPHMIRAGGGSIINIASLGGLRCLPAMPAYNASKAGLIMLTKQTALDYGPRGIRCNAVCPGGVRTEMIKGPMSETSKALGISLEELLGRWSADVPLRRVAKPSEIAGICSYLASDDASFVTGAALLVDGGAAVVDVAGAAMERIFTQGKVCE